MANEVTASKLEVLNVDVNENKGTLSITSYCETEDSGGDLSLIFKKWDADEKQFVDDDATKAAADETLTKLFDKTVDDLIADPACIEGVEFEGYISSTGDRVFATPPQSFVTCSKVDKKAKDAIKKLQFPIQSLPVKDVRLHGISAKSDAFYSRHEIEVIVPVDVAGETKYFRISQIASPDGEGRATSLKYKDSMRGGHTTAQGFAQCDADNKLQLIAEGKFDTKPQVAAQYEKIANNALDAARDRAVNEINERYGIDVLVDGAENGVEIVDIDVATMPANNSMYLIATLGDGAPF